MRDANRVRLLFGPYQAPALERGDRATCLYRDCDVVVTGWTDARSGAAAGPAFPLLYRQIKYKTIGRPSKKNQPMNATSPGCESRQGPVRSPNESS